MISEIISAALEPLASTEAWYGVLLALAFSKQMRKLGEGIYGMLEKKIPDSEDNVKKEN